MASADSGDGDGDPDNAGDICTCEHSADWHHENGCNADNDCEDGDACRCYCTGFKLLRTEAAHCLRRRVLACTDRLQDDEGALRRLLSAAESLMAAREGGTGGRMGGEGRRPQ